MDEFARRRVVLDLPGARDVSVNKDLVYKSVAGLELKADVYAPTEAEPKELRPGVILVHGDGPPDLLASAREWGLYESWGRLVAASGLVGIAFNHRSSEGRTRLPEAAGDVEDLLEWVQENHREIGVTPTRLCLWTCSAGPPVAFRKVLGGGLDPVRCLVALYGLMDLEHLRDEIPHAPGQGRPRRSSLQRLDRRVRREGPGDERGGGPAHPSAGAPCLRRGR